MRRAWTWQRSYAASGERFVRLSRCAVSFMRTLRRAPPRAPGREHRHDGGEPHETAHPEDVARVGMIEQPAIEDRGDDAGDGKTAGDEAEHLAHFARGCQRADDHVARRGEKTV